MSETKPKLVLAYSGGLDTSVILKWLCEKGFDQKYGARPLKRAIQNHVEDLIAEEIVKSNLKEGTKIKIDCSKDDSKLKIIKL